jgi:hypothetical protein
MNATGIGVVLSQIAVPPAERDPELPAVAREFVLRAITTEDDAGPAAPTGVANRAVALREALGDGEPTGLTAGEEALLSELLDRMANAG